MKKNKATKELVRNLVRIAVIITLGIIISFILCKREAKANSKILEQTANDAFAFQNIMLVHSLEPHAPEEYMDISSLENSTDDEADFQVDDLEIKTGASQYYIRVNYGANCVTIYKKDDEGFYTKPYKSMICSSGKSTPKSGTYKISYKYRWLSLYGGVYGQYSTRIVKNILFHSVPYYKQRADSLEYEEYDKLGTTASAGCIRLTVIDAKWIYDNITSGTYVEFYSDPSNPGPLGKPKAAKISDNKENRDWDPTDPDINNPWNGGSGIPSVTYTPPTTYTKTEKTTNNDNDDDNKKSSSKEEDKTPATTTVITNTSNENQSNTKTDKKTETNTKTEQTTSKNEEKQPEQTETTEKETETQKQTQKDNDDTSKETQNNNSADEKNTESNSKQEQTSTKPVEEKTVEKEPEPKKEESKPAEKTEKEESKSETTESKEKAEVETKTESQASTSSNDKVETQESDNSEN